MDDDVWIADVTLAASAQSGEELRAFYGDRLGFQTTTAGAELALAVGRAALRFAPARPGDEPFYHLALLVPGDRYEAARDWARSETELLHRPGETSTTFAFPAWDALACYFHDPVGNIVELIAHRGIDAGGRTGPFVAGEITAISEVGLVAADPAAAAGTLASAGLELWSGDTAGDAALAFVGRQAHTLILTSRARPWLPTQRPAEGHPASVTVRDGSGQKVRVEVDAGTVTAR